MCDPQMVPAAFGGIRQRDEAGKGTQARTMVELPFQLTYDWLAELLTVGLLPLTG